MKNYLFVHLVLVACVGLTGCAGVGVKNTMRPSTKHSQWNPFTKLKDSKKSKNKVDQMPQSMAAIWKDSVLEKPGSTPVRGFGGRIFFYDQDSTAVTADGELVIYGFDDSVESGTDDPKADRKFVFKSDQFQSHFSKTDLGSSYSVWIPWEKIGGDRKTITLIPVFKMADGTVLKSGQSINVLPGKAPEVYDTAKTGGKKNETNVSLAGFDSPGSKSSHSTDVAQADLVEEPIYNETKIRTSTISLTPSLSAQLSQPLALPNSTESTTSKTKPGEFSSRNQSNRGESSTGIQKDGASNHSSINQNSTEAMETTSPAAKPRSVFGSPGTFR